MQIPITIWFDEHEARVVQQLTAKYGRTDEGQLRIWIGDALSAALREAAAEQWDRRKRVLEARPELAAPIDAVRG